MVAADNWYVLHGISKLLRSTPEPWLSLGGHWLRGWCPLFRHNFSQAFSWNAIHHPRCCARKAASSSRWVNVTSAPTLPKRRLSFKRGNKLRFGQTGLTAVITNVAVTLFQFSLHLACSIKWLWTIYTHKGASQNCPL